MTQRFRHTQSGKIDRSKVIHFTYDNKRYEGHPGDTLASALLANGVRLVGRSFKYHRPRGIFTAGSEEPNALVQLESGAHTEPNRRATEVELYEGLSATSQNCWPSVEHDVGAVNSFLSRLFPAGFYYKTFMWPASLWMTYEKFIRRAAGLGKSPTEIDPDAYDKQHVHSDILVIGGGPAGLQAAYTAGKAGARVIIADEHNELGGYLRSEKSKINDQHADDWLTHRISELEAMDNVHILRRTTVTGYYDYNFLVANERVSEHLGPNKPKNQAKERLYKIRAKQVILAAGSIERPLVFADNDRPGVMLASAIRTYLNQYGVLVGNSIVFHTNNDSAYLAAIDVCKAGAQVRVIDVRKSVHSDIRNQAEDAGVQVLLNSAITGVDYKKGEIRGIEVCQLDDTGEGVLPSKQTLECDTIGVSGGWTPTVHLFSQSKGKLDYNEQLHCFVPGKEHSTNPCHIAGACGGSFSLETCLNEGYTAAKNALSAIDNESISQSIIENPVQSADAEATLGELRPLWIVPCEHPIGQGKKKHFHELHNDSTVADVMLAQQEGFESVEHTKRYTTTGMGTDQGKTSNVNAMVVMAKHRNITVPQVGTTTFRPPFTPLSLGSVVGHDRRELFLQKRKTAIHAWHDENGAVYEDVGDWKRPFYFPKAGESMHDAVQRESKAVRDSVGVLDASTLGKIDIQGKDAAWLLNMLYTNAWTKLKPGHCRYGLMLNEHGMVFDDGVTTCLAEGHYHMTTTTGGAGRVMNWIEEWIQTEWPEKEIFATSVTEQWAVAALNGPNSDKVLAKLTDEDISDFKFMTMREMTIAGIPARVYRISFTGELSFEINVPARYGLTMWQAIMQAGEEFNITPYGTETMHVLRAEKGFIIVGQDTDGTVTPYDLGMDWIVKKKGDFLGKRSLSRSDTARPDRKQLVGVMTEDPQVVLQEGAHVVAELKDKPPMDMLGNVTSSYMSPNLGRSFAMALIKDGFNRIGQTYYVPTMDGKAHKVTITDTNFLK